VTEGFSAANAGVRAGDLAVAVDGSPVKDWQAFIDALNKVAAKTPARLTLIREGKTFDLMVVPRY
jgi:S1-C subfamily serine protease